MCSRQLAAANEPAEVTGSETMARERGASGVAGRQGAKEPAVGAPAAAAGQLKATATATATARRGGEPEIEKPAATPIPTQMTQTSRSFYGEPCPRLERGLVPAAVVRREGTKREVKRGG